MRNRYGKFFYRVPDGESSADVHDRVSAFLEGLWRDMETNRYGNGPSDELNLIVVSHGLTSSLFLMKCSTGLLISSRAYESEKLEYEIEVGRNGEMPAGNLEND
ncbi:UNVERIFIED_CONTAM: Phosphoglycerate mutase-like protein AT74H [Sesamum latifolium]|uniref:Phosphoglycerate mutase-like protein AT74H n=1 Tax=Sesamum latifolium TaxID=2727402 RepID=A0AAW2XDC6_9LAMI